MNDVPFEFLSRKWVKILKLAFDEAEKYGKNPEKFNVEIFYMEANPVINKKIATYAVFFYEHQRHWMDGFEETDDRFTVVINATNLQFIGIEIGRD